MGLLILLSLLIEAGVLLFLEVKAWNTLYTPLAFLMLPYVAVLLITIAISGHLGFVEFYYPTILYWSAGLLCFAIPSYVLGFTMQKHGKSVSKPIDDGNGLSKTVVVLTFIMCLAFLYRLKQVLGSSASSLGSDDFGMDFNGHGLWAHLSKINSVLLVLCIYFYDRSKRWLWIPILLLVFFAFIHQVKGWVIIPCVAGLSMRLYSGKTRLTGKLLLYVLLGAIMVFLISYIMSLVLGGDVELSGTVIGFIFRHFVHYLTSGTLGFSMDLSAGLPDKGSFQVLFAPIVNIVNLLSGNNEIVSPINDCFHYTGVNFTNTRTFFGYIAVHANAFQFIGTTLFFSLITYLIKILCVKYNNVYLNVIYFYQCALLCMGWFDYYYSQMDSIEIPVVTIIVMAMVSLLDASKKETV